MHIFKTGNLQGISQGFPGGACGKEPPVYSRDLRDTGSISGSKRAPGEGHGNPLQYSCLENPMGRGASWATAHRVAESGTAEAT